jgi:hypothetical protein
LVSISKTLNFFRGSIYVVKGKVFETGGGISKSQKCFLQSYSYTFDYLQKDFENILQKICKTKQMVQMWYEMLNKRKTIHSLIFILSDTFNWFNSK